MGRKIGSILLPRDTGLNTTDTDAKFPTILPKNRMHIQRLHVADTSLRSQETLSASRWYDWRDIARALWTYLKLRVFAGVFDCGEARWELKRRSGGFCGIWWHFWENTGLGTWEKVVGFVSLSYQNVCGTKLRWSVYITLKSWEGAGLHFMTSSSSRPPTPPKTQVSPALTDWEHP